MWMHSLTSSLFTVYISTNTPTPTHPHTRPSPTHHTTPSLSYYSLVSVVLVLRASPTERAPSSPILLLSRLRRERRGERGHQQIPKHSPLSNTQHHSLPLLLQSGQRGVGLEGIAHGTRPIIPNVVVFQTAEREEVREGINKYPHTPTPTHSPISNKPHHSLPLLLQLSQRGVGLERIAHGTRPISPNAVVL